MAGKVFPAHWQVALSTQKVVKPATDGASQTAEGAAVGRTSLACTDVHLSHVGTAHAWGFTGLRIDEGALEAALAATLADLPFLAGRLRGLEQGTASGIYIAHTADGALLTVAKAEEGVKLESMSVLSWRQLDVTHQEVPPPFYIDQMVVNTPEAMYSEPLLKVRLTRLEDGDILSITFNHALADGMHAAAMLEHLSARYRQHAGKQAEADPAGLLASPPDRSMMTVENLAVRLLGEEAGRAWRPPAFDPRPSLGRIWRTMRYLSVLTKRSCDIVRLHVPEADVARLKALAAEGSPVAGVSRGDAMQAACAMLTHAARGRPLLPAAPQQVSILLQYPAPEGYFGNAVYHAFLSLPKGTKQPGGGRYVDGLRQLAGAIRKTTMEARSNPEVPLVNMHQSQVLSTSPMKLAPIYYYGEVLRHVTCCTNYVPVHRKLDLGLGAPPTYHNEMTTVRGFHMAIIRAATDPELAPAGSSADAGSGLLLTMQLTRRQVARLRSHGVLHELLPGARFL